MFHRGKKLHSDLMKLRVKVNAITYSTMNKAQQQKALLAINLIDASGRRWMPGTDGSWLAGYNGNLMEADPAEYVPIEEQVAV